MPSGIYVRTSKMMTGKCESIEKRKEIAEESWKCEEVRKRRIAGLKAKWNKSGIRTAWNKGIKTGIQSSETKEKRKIFKFPILKNKDWLTTKYITEGMTIDEIANLIGGNYAVVNFWLHKFNIFKDTRSEWMQKWGASYLNSFIKNPSWPQIKLFNKVQKFYEGPVLNYRILRYSIDIAIPSLMIAIEYDGSYWHKDEEKDMKRQKQIEEEGWKFIRYKNHIPEEKELIQDIERVKKCEL